MEAVLASIYAAVDEINALRPPSRQLPKSPDTELVGPAGLLDSLGFVNFIVAVEVNVEQQSGISINLADQQAMSQENSPFRTISTFAEYISRLLEEKRHGTSNP